MASATRVRPLIKCKKNNKEPYKGGKQWVVLKRARRDVNLQEALAKRVLPLSAVSCEPSLRICRFFSPAKSSHDGGIAFAAGAYQRFHLEIYYCLCAGQQFRAPSLRF